MGFPKNSWYFLKFLHDEDYNALGSILGGGGSPFMEVTTFSYRLQGPTLNPKPLNPKPYTLNPKPQTLADLEPQGLNKSLEDNRVWDGLGFEVLGLRMV